MKYKAVGAIVVTLGMATLGAVPANAAPDNLATGSGIVALSSGDDLLGFGRISVSAHVGVGESRASARGQVQFQIPNGERVHGTINCLLTRDNGQAGMSGTLKEPVDGNMYFRISISDNDGAGTDTPDQVDVVFLSDPIGCAQFNPVTPVQSGNFVVQSMKE